MKIPKQIKLGGHKINITLTPDSAQKSTRGFADVHDMTIVINAGRPEDIQAETLMHEIFEHINECNNLNRDHTIMTVLSEQIFSVIRNNGLRFDQE